MNSKSQICYISLLAKRDTMSIDVIYKQALKIIKRIKIYSKFYRDKTYTFYQIRKNKHHYDQF